MKEAQEGGAECFIFVTGQILQLAEKMNLKRLSLINDTKIFDCNDIMSVVSTLEVGFLRAELGFRETRISHDQAFFEKLFSTVSFSRLIHLLNESLEPKIFPYGFIDIFDTLEVFSKTAQPELLSKDLKNAFLNWRDAVDVFCLQLLGLEQFDYKDNNDTLVMKRVPSGKYQSIFDAMMTAYSDMATHTVELAKLAEKRLRVPIR